MKPQKAGWLVALAILIVFTVILVGTSLYQNRKVEEHINAYLTAVQNRDLTTIGNFYYAADFLDMFGKVVFKHRLLGWKITGITGQPWPMDSTERLHIAKVDLYYDLPDEMIQPKGKYATSTAYGPCAVVPVTLQFRYQSESGWFMMPPYADSTNNWPCPYDVTPPAAPAKK